MFILILFALFLVLQDARKLEQLYCDPSQRLVADCILMDVDTAVVSDRKGSIAVLSCSDRLEGKKLLKDVSPCVAVCAQLLPKTLTLKSLNPKNYTLKP